ncbi:MAG: sulfotransferase [Gammaproteobacteria bacterium]
MDQGIPGRLVDAIDQLHQTARAQTGLADFGRPDYMEGLRRLFEAVDGDCPIGDAGRAVAFGMALTPLKARLHTEAGWQRHPGCLKNPIKAPLIIMGIPRTGTTALHGMLAVDPQFQVLEHWLIPNPIPRPPREQWAAHPLFQASAAALEATYTILPKLKLTHEVSVDGADECLGPMQQGFVNNTFTSSLYVPSYDRWYRAQSEADSYRRYADILRLIGSNEPAKPWLLKNPTNIFRVENLLEVFPDARLVQTHRHPRETIPSLASLLTEMHAMAYGDPHHRQIGEREQAFWGIAARRTMALRARQPGRICDVDYRAFMRDPFSVIERIYRHFDLELTGAARAAMRAWLDGHPQNRHGAHRYTLEDFGLTPDSIQEHYGEYIRTYGLE